LDIARRLAPGPPWSAGLEILNIREAHQSSTTNLDYANSARLYQFGNCLAGNTTNARGLGGRNPFANRNLGRRFIFG